MNREDTQVQGSGGAMTPSEMLDKSLRDIDIKDKIIEAIGLLHEAATKLGRLVEVQVAPNEVQVRGADTFRHSYALGPYELTNTLAAAKCAQAVLGERDRTQGWE